MKAGKTLFIVTVNQEDKHISLLLKNKFRFEAEINPVPTTQQTQKNTIFGSRLVIFLVIMF